MTECIKNQKTENIPSCQIRNFCCTQKKFRLIDNIILLTKNLMAFSKCILSNHIYCAKKVTLKNPKYGLFEKMVNRRLHNRTEKNLLEAVNPKPLFDLDQIWLDCL